MAAQADPRQTTRLEAACPRAVARSAEGLVLCGGRSSRLGRDKARLAAGGRSLLERAVGVLAPHVDRCRLACGPTPRYAELGLPLVLDASPSGEGPLAGLAAGLASAGAEWVFALACDMPAVDDRLVGALLEHARREDLDVCLALGPRGPEPLCGVYRTTCAGPMRDALEAGERRVVSFWGRSVRSADGARRPLRVGGLDAQALRAAGSRADVTANVNTPAEWARARAALEGGGAA